MMKQAAIIQKLLPIACSIRKIYSSVFYWLLWHIYIRSTYNYFIATYGEPETALSNLRNIDTAKFRSILRNMKWKMEKAGGMFDVTYKETGVLSVADVYTKWGRDCDDFANLCMEYARARDWSEMHMILITTGRFRYMFGKSHFIAAGKRSDKHLFEVFDNNFTYMSTFTSLDDLIKSYCIQREAKGPEYSDSVWCVYSSFKGAGTQ